MKVRVIEVIVPSTGGYDVFVSSSYEEARFKMLCKHFGTLEEVLSYVSDALKDAFRLEEVLRSTGRGGSRGVE
jgi:hypothetical protein